MPQPSTSGEPFGFTFIHNDQLLVTEADCTTPQPPGLLPTCAVPPAQPAFALYAVADDGQLTLIRSLPTGQAANCWAVVTKDQRFAFTAAALALPSEVQGLPRLGSVTGFRFDLLD